MDDPFQELSVGCVHSTSGEIKSSQRFTALLFETFAGTTAALRMEIGPEQNDYCVLLASF